MPAPDRVLDDLDLAAHSFARLRTTEAREELIRRCLPFARRLARRYRGRGEPFEDLEQVARLGLMKAIDRYDPERGSFTAYAVVTISGEIKRHFRDRTWGVHVPRRLQELGLEVGHAATALAGTLQRTPTVAELAGRLHTSEGAVQDALESAAGYAPASLNVPVGGPDGSSEFGDLLGGPDGDLEAVEDRVTVAGLLLRMPARERQMLAMRFYGNRTQTEIAAELGISQMHVSRLLSRALGWLREAMLNDAPPRWEGIITGSERHVQISVHRDGGRLTVALRGEVDRDDADRLRTALRRAVAEAGADTVAVDLSAVPLVDAAGVAVLLDLTSAAAVAEVELVLTGARGYVSKILAVSGLNGLLRDQ
jgi:RNA polymerase sigma-B factor